MTIEQELNKLAEDITLSQKEVIEIQNSLISNPPSKKGERLEHGMKMIMQNQKVFAFALFYKYANVDYLSQTAKELNDTIQKEKEHLKLVLQDNIEIPQEFKDYLND